VRALAHAAEGEAPAHAYLITGPARIGKRTLARELAAALNCTAAPAERPCHACASCRMIAHEAHPDLIMVERGEERRLTVEQVRDARGSVEWRPYQGRFKVYVFPEADEWGNVEASSNALLKTLEEPPPQVVLALTASQAEALPITVVSRCRVLPLQPVPIADLADGLTRLYGTPPTDAQRLAALSRGRPGWAIAALDAPEAVARREDEVSMAVALSDGLLGSRLLRAGQACQGANFMESRALCLAVLEDMAQWWRDLLLVSADSAAPLTHEDRRDELAQQAQRRGRARIAKGLRDIEQTAGAVERNVTPRLALEALLLRLG